MGKKGGSAPAAPDPVATAAAQTASNTQAAIDNARFGAVDSYGPGGSVTYQRREDGTPYSQTTSLSPTQQSAFDSQSQVTLDLSNRASTALAAAPQTSFSLDGVPYDPRAVDTSGYRSFNTTSTPRPGSEFGGSGSRSVWGGSPNPSQSHTGPNMVSLGSKPTQPSGPRAPITPVAMGSQLQPNQQTDQPAAGANMVAMGSKPAQPSGPVNRVTPVAMGSRPQQSQDSDQQQSIWGGQQQQGSQDSSGNLPYDPNSYGSVTEFDNNASRAVLSDFDRNMTPQFDTQNRALDNDLVNRGIAVGSEAWNRARSDLALQQNNARLGAQNQATLTGHQVAGDVISREQSLRGTAYNEALTTHNQQNTDFTNRLNMEQTLRGQIIGENERVRNSAINDASIYLSGAPAIAMPSGANNANYNTQATDVAGITQQGYANQMQQWNQRQAQTASMWQGIGSLAGTAVMMSSKDFKEDVGEADAFLKRVQKVHVRTWRYDAESAQKFGADRDRHIGPFAEEWSALFGGPSDRIHLGDAIFTLYKAFQELTAKVERMEKAHA